MNGKLRKILSTCLLSLSLITPVYAGVELILQVNSSSEVVAPGAKRAAPTFELVTLRIEDGWVEIEEEGRSVVFDRTGERLIAFDPNSNDFDVNAAYALHDYRTASYRMLIGEKRFGFPARSYGTGDPQVLLDHVFGFTSPEDTAKPVMKETTLDRSWYSGDVELASLSKRGTELTDAQMRMVGYWMRQTSGGHPVIIDDMVERGVMPDSITLYMNDGQNLKTVEIELIGVRKIADQTIDQRLEGLSRHIEGAGEDAFFALLDWIVSRSAFAESISNHGTGDITAARTAFENGDPIRGILETIRLEMVTGQRPEISFDDYSELIDNSRSATNLLRSLSASTPELFSQAVQTLDVLSDAFEDQSGVLNLLTAEFLVRLNQAEMAERLYRKVIMSEPDLAMAYKNYGDLMREEGRYPLGWLLYEAFEVVAPNHPSNEQINTLRATYKEAFPGFF